LPRKHWWKCCARKQPIVDMLDVPAFQLSDFTAAFIGQKNTTWCTCIRLFICISDAVVDCFSSFTSLSSSSSSSHQKVLLLLFFL
jgi:hypothetical protein